MDDAAIASRIAGFPRWHYRFDLRGHLTPVSEAQANRHEQRRRYILDPLLALCGGSLEGRRVLDLGCNAGFWTLAALRAGAAHVVAVDGRSMHMEQARFVLEVEEVDPARYDVVQADVLALELERWGRFDVVLCLGLLYHVSDPIGLVERIGAANDDLLVVDTALSPAPGPAFTLRREPLEDPRNALARELVLVPTRDAVIELTAACGYAGVCLRPSFESYEGAEDYRDGHRRAFLCAKRSDLTSPSIQQVAEPTSRC